MRKLIGAIVWLLIVCSAVFFCYRIANQPDSSSYQLFEYWTASPRQIELEFETPLPIRVGDPIVQFFGDKARMVGVVRHVEKADSRKANLVVADRAYAELFGSGPADLGGMQVAYHSTPESIEWVLQTMLPPATRERIRQLVVEAYKEHQAEIMAELQPVLEKTFRDATQMIKAEFRRSVLRRDQQIQQLGQRYQTDLVDERLVPLVQEEIWPIIERLGKPIVIEIGSELWAEASIWRFGWRFLYDQTPLPQRDLAQKEFERFVGQKARPIIQQKLPQIIASQQEVLTDVSRNEKVRETVSESIRMILRDAEFQTLVADVMKDVLVDNEELHQALAENWNSPEAQHAMEVANERLDRTVTQIGQTLFGSPDSEITPEFSRVLRNQIMQKDQRWLVLEASDYNSLAPSPGDRIRVVRPEKIGPDPFYSPRRPR